MHEQNACYQRARPPHSPPLGPARLSLPPPTPQVLLAMGWVHKFRWGLIGLLIPVTVLLMHTT